MRRRNGGKDKGREGGVREGGEREWYEDGRRERERRVGGGRILIQADTSTASHEIKKIR